MLLNQSWGQDVIDIDYTCFNKVEKIKKTESSPYTYWELEFDYDPFGNRRKTAYSNLDNPIETKYFVDNYEVIINEVTGNEKKLHYIHAGPGLMCVMEQTGTTKDLHYIHTYHLGSIEYITNGSGAVEQKLSYDPWGRLRDHDTWSYSDAAEPMFDRGFTTHEHLTEFNLINMNGRVYDPVLGVFLSPDPYVQMPDYTQNFNRYAYCLNNPLIYTDPSGEFIFTALAAIFAPPLLPMAIGADIFSTGNLISHAVKGDVNNLGDGLKYYSQGALAGAALGAAYMYAPLIPGVGQGIQSGMTIYGKVNIWSTAISGGSGLLQGAFTDDWSALENAGEIFLGNFYLDENKGLFGGAWEGISRHTWEFAQTGIGHSIAQLRNTFGAVDEVMYTDGITIALNYEAWSGSKYSLGNFINFGTDYTKEEFAVYDNLDLLHEMGHSHQSKRLGPLYLGIVIASPISAMFSRQIEGEPYGVRTHGMTPYERWANKLAKKYYKKYYSRWDEIYYPIKKR